MRASACMRHAACAGGERGTHDAHMRWHGCHTTPHSQPQRQPQRQKQQQSQSQSQSQSPQQPLPPLLPAPGKPPEGKSKAASVTESVSSSTPSTSAVALCSLGRCRRSQLAWSGFTISWRPTSAKALNYIRQLQTLGKGLGLLYLLAGRVLVPALNG